MAEQPIDYKVLDANIPTDIPHHFSIATSHGRIRGTSIGTGSPAILMIHGNSFSSTIFKHVFQSSLSSQYQLVTFDLPGHGRSDNAIEPEKSYTQTGYGDAAIQVLTALEIADVVVVGWSLGGHIAIEMASIWTHIKGVMLIGTPPVNTGEIPLAFNLAGSGGDWHKGYPARNDLKPFEQLEYARVCADPPYEDWMAEAVARCDQQARSIMFDAFAGPGAVVTQREIVESKSDLLWAVVNGSDEPWINLQFIRNIKFAKLWKNQCIEMEGLKHAPFWAKPIDFQLLLEEYVKDIVTFCETTHLTAPLSVRETKRNGANEH